MKNRPFFWHILPSFLFICAFISIVLLLYTTREFKQFYLDLTRTELKNRAILLGQLVHDVMDDSVSVIDSLVVQMGKQTDTRFTIILPDGKVIGDTREDPSIMDNHDNRPEIISALEGDTGVAVRYSNTLSRELMYVAIPVKKADSVTAVIRSSVPFISLAERMEAFYSKLIFAGIVIIILALLISIWLSRRLSRPLIHLKNAADTFAKGTFTPVPLLPNHSVETAELAAAMDSMAIQLAERIATITQQKNEQNAILSAMVEGVVAIDMDGHIIMLNSAAAEMFNINEEAVKGKLVQEAIRNTAFQKFVSKLLKKKIQLKKEIHFSSNVEHITEIQGTVLRGAYKDEIIGVLVVMHDVTHLKRLENIRRDFVANVSHELRTPLTSIKGFVETLLDGAVNDPKESERFLRIVNNQVNRLNALIEDLLTISRLEKEEAHDEFILEPVAIDNVVENAVKFCSSRADEKHITISLNPGSKSVVPLNAMLFEQACINLVDNAIKYSDENTQIIIRTAVKNGSVTIDFIDQGPGISKRHLPRIFERFYRVDKARSRKMGGTGLGLSIVKHIVRLHNGSVQVASEVGKGSTFTIILPGKSE